MKKMIFAIATMLLMVACGGKPEKKCVIDGDFGTLSGQVSIVDEVSAEAIATAELVDGKFSMTIEENIPAFAVLVVNEQPVAPVFIENASLKVVGDEELTKVVVSGSEANDSYTDYMQRGKAMLENISVAMSDSENVSQEQVKMLIDELHNLTYECFEENKTNLFGAYLLCSSIAAQMEPTEVIEIIADFPKDIQQMEVVKKCKARAETMLQTTEGSAYTDVKGVDAEGSEIKLSEVLAKNKYVLLDFWASWCGPCIGEMPHLREAYAEYHDKGFEIFGVSVDDDVDAWKRTMSAHKMTWVNVHDTDKSAAMTYAVASIPTNFLIDSATGKIVAKNLRGEAVVEKLAELLN